MRLSICSSTKTNNTCTIMYCCVEGCVWRGRRTACNLMAAAFPYLALHFGVFQAVALCVFYGRAFYMYMYVHL